jgi:uncharacterized membrane protein YoaK (UPF0700 family)
VIAKLPRWVLSGGVGLAFIAGMINAMGYLGFRHQAVTHMTGTTSLLGIVAVHGDVRDIVYFGTVLLAFVGGCALSGFIVGDGALQLGRRYAAALAVESALLFLAVPLLQQQNEAGLWLAAAASGLQNAMAATYSGAVVRTSHVSGIVTDLGMFLGHWLRGDRPDGRRVRLYCALFIGFLAGGVASALAFPYWRERTLLVPAVLTGCVGLAYVAYRHWLGVRGQAG